MTISLKVPVAYSSDIEGEIQVFDFDRDQGFESQKPDDVIFGLSFDVGPASAKGADMFQVVVLTPNNRARVRPGEKMIMLDLYSFAALKSCLLAVVKSCERETWYDCLKSLRDHFRWEYEGMYSEDDLKRVNS